MLYDAACVPVLQLISQTYAQGSRTAEVEEALSAHFGQVHEVVTPRQEIATIPPLAELAPILQAFTVTIERLALAVERQNEFLENLTRGGVALPGESPQNSRQEAPGGPGEREAAEPEGAAPENASGGRSRPSWWRRLFGR